jgi:hypothetical protein
MTEKSSTTNQPGPIRRWWQRHQRCRWCVSTRAKHTWHLDGQYGHDFTTRAAERKRHREWKMAYGGRPWLDD